MKTQCIAVLGVLLSCATQALADQDKNLELSDKEATNIVSQIKSDQSLITQHLKQAKPTSLAVYTCIENKLKLNQRFLVVAQRSAKLHRQSKNKKTPHAQRLRSAEEGAAKLLPLALQCWCEDNAALTTVISRWPEGELDKVQSQCQPGPENETVVTLKAPAALEAQELEPTDEDVDTEDENYGFPAIPAASPFR